MLLTVKEFADREKVSIKAIYQRINRKRLVPVKKYGRILIEVDDEKSKIKT